MASSFIEFIPNLAIEEEWRHALETQAMMHTLGEGVAEAAKTLVPVRTGALQASIEAHSNQDAEVDIEATVPYAAFVEFGTSKMAPRPYLRPALDAVVGR